MRTTRKRLAWVMTMVLLVPAVVPAARAARRGDEVPVVELRNHDMAFALTMEALRRVQGSLIENDYEARLEAASRLRRPDAQRTVQTLADLERFLRFRRLRVQTERLTVAYEYARRHDENAAGIRVPAVFDMAAAGRMLDGFIPVAGLDTSAPVFDPGRPLAVSYISAQTGQPMPWLPVATPVCRWCDAFASHLALLGRVADATNALAASVATMIGQELAGQAGAVEEPALVMVSYRRSEQQPRALVAQTFDSVADASTNRATRLSGRNDEFYDLADRWFDLVSKAHRTWYGPASEVRQRQRAFDQMLQSDVTFVREQTVEPLYVEVTMPRPDAFLPSCLRGKIAAGVTELELTPTQWHARMHLLTTDQENARSVARILGAWRDLLSSASAACVDKATYQTSRQAMQQSTIEVRDSEVVLDGGIPSNLGYRVVAKILAWGME